MSKYINNIFSKLGIPPLHDDNRRVLASLAYLNGWPDAEVAVLRRTQAAIVDALEMAAVAR
ncbi:hypothetical protein [Micromonospora sp. NPDC005113]